MIDALKGLMALFFYGTGCVMAMVGFTFALHILYGVVFNIRRKPKEGDDI